MDKPKIQFIAFATTGAQPYVESTRIKPVNNCNGYLAINTGDSTVIVDGHVLYPGVPGTNNGDSIAVGGNEGEILKSDIQITILPGGVNPQVTINQKYYLLYER